MRRIPVAAVWLAGAVPFAVLLWDTLQGQLGVDPIRDIEHRLGRTAVYLLLATLAVTAKNVALRMSGSSALSGPVSHAIEIGGALLIIAMGVILLGGALGA